MFGREDAGGARLVLDDKGLVERCLQMLTPDGPPVCSPSPL
jgi:hypothetical protein